jgi:hypothetical protein
VAETPSTPPAQFTEANLERVQEAAYDLAMRAPTLVDGHPLFAVAALTMAACHAAILTETSFETLSELLKLHFVTAETGIAAARSEAPTTRPPGGQQ